MLIAPHCLGSFRHLCDKSASSEVIRWLESFKSLQLIWCQPSKVQASKPPSWKQHPIHQGSRASGSLGMCIFHTGSRTKSSHPQRLNRFDLSQGWQTHCNPHQWFKALGLMYPLKTITKQDTPPPPCHTPQKNSQL